MQNVITTNQKKKRKGFTLIELIIVLAVMAIIAAIAIPNLVGVKNNAAVKTDKESAKTIERAIEVLIADDTIKLPTTDPLTFTITPGEANTEPAVSNGLTTGVDELKASLKGIEAPRENGKSLYNVKITTAGVVTVSTNTIP